MAMVANCSVASKGGVMAGRTPAGRSLCRSSAIIAAAALTKPGVAGSRGGRMCHVPATRTRLGGRMVLARAEGSGDATKPAAKAAADDADCVGTGMDVTCETDWGVEVQEEMDSVSLLSQIGATLVIISPFFFWGTAMVAMKGTLDHTTPQFVATLRLIPAGALIVAFAAFQGRPMPSGTRAWLALALFGLIDGTGFQGFLAEGLQRTPAGLGSVVIDSQPLTVALLASVFFGESIAPVGYVGMLLGVAGLFMLEVPLETLQGMAAGTSPLPVSGFMPADLGDSGIFWMLLAAQSMAVGTVMVKWVCKGIDPVQATGWHMILGGIPLAVYSAMYETGQVEFLTLSDDLSLFYTSVFGSAVAYSVFFYQANKGNLTKLSSLTFLTPMFAAAFGYVLLGETLTPFQLGGAAVTLAGVGLINQKPGGGGGKKGGEEGGGEGGAPAPKEA